MASAATIALVAAAAVALVLFGVLFVQQASLRWTIVRLEQETMDGNVLLSPTSSAAAATVRSYSVAIDRQGTMGLAAVRFSMAESVPLACERSSSALDTVDYDDRVLVVLQRTPVALELLSAVQGGTVSHVLAAGQVCRIMDASKQPAVAEAVKVARLDTSSPIVLGLGARPRAAGACGAGLVGPVPGAGETQLAAVLRNVPFAIFWGWGRV